MSKLGYYRKKIDYIDKNIVKLLSQRFNLVEQIAIYKEKNKIKIVDRKRELQIINNIKKYTNRTHQKFFEKIFDNIINYSRKLQK